MYLYPQEPNTHTLQKNSYKIYLFSHLGAVPDPFPIGWILGNLHSFPTTYFSVPLPLILLILIRLSTSPLSQLTAAPNKPARTNPNHKQQYTEPTTLLLNNLLASAKYYLVFYTLTSPSFPPTMQGDREWSFGQFISCGFSHCPGRGVVPLLYCGVSPTGDHSSQTTPV